MTAPQLAVGTPEIGVPGQIPSLRGLQDATINTALNEEASAGMPFGIFVREGAADEGALLLSATSQRLKGVVVHHNSYARPYEVDTDGIQPGTHFGLLFHGPILVTVEDAVTPASEVHVRAVATGGEQKGAVRGTADSTDCIDASGFCRFLTTAGAGELAVLMVDMVNSGLQAAD